MNPRPSRTYNPTPTDITTIEPSPNHTTTVVMPLAPLRDAFAGSSRDRPASAHDLPLWRPAVAPDASVLDFTPPPTAPTEQTAIDVVAADVVSHVIQQQFNKARRQFLRCCDEVHTVHADTVVGNDIIMWEAMTGVAAIMAELDEVAESLGFHTASVRRLGKSLATGAMTPDDVLAELHALG